MRILGLVLAFLFLSFAPVQAESLVVQTCGILPLAYKVGATRTDTVDINGNKCILGSITASLAGFAPATTGTPISVTTGGVSGTLPAGAVVVASNVGATNGAYCKLGASATTSDQLIPPNSWFAFTVGAATQLTCITSTSTTTVNMVGGSGLPTGAGGGAAGSGGGGAITAASGSYAAGSIASGAMVDLGLIADAASSAGGTGTLSAKLRLMTTQLGTINTTLNAPMQNSGGSVTANAGTNLNTSALATSANQVTNGATTNHTCSVSGFSELGCLGQIDDDVKGPIAAQTTNTVNIGAVMNAGSRYQTVAASATATVLQSSAGATGDYLSHCVIHPGTTSPGVAQVFDSTNSAANLVVNFAGGSSSVSNLTEIAVPVGAVSLNGAWKVTTGTNVTITCYGKFS